MTFANPYALLLLLPLAFAAWRMLRRSRGRGLKFSAVSRIPVKTASWRVFCATFTPYIAILGMLLLVLACARPRIPLGKDRKNVDAIAIAMVVDVSGSMNALDLTPKGVAFSKDTTRLSVVKKVFADFVEKRPDDLISLVTFGTYATARTPLTSDHETLLNVLKGVEIPVGDGEAETAIGDGLSVGLLRIKDAKPKSKIVILLSDGACTVGAEQGGVDPQAATEVAAKMGVKVYTIGVGSKAQLVPFLLTDGYGRNFIRRGASGFDEALLKNIAATTSGMYFAVNDRDGLEMALEEIDKLETTPLEVDEWKRWIEYFPMLLSFGASLVALSSLLSMLAVRRLI